MKETVQMKATKEELVEVLKRSSILTLVNEENLEREGVYRQYMDVYIQLKLMVQDNGRMGTGTIKRKMLEMAEMSEDEVFEEALKNTEEMGLCITGMFEEMKRVELIDGEEELTNILTPDKDIEIVSNYKGIYGAIAIMYESIQERLAQIYGGDYYIVLSSVHEALAMNLDTPIEDIMISNKENKEFLKKNEILSLGVYRYDSKDKKIYKVA